MKLLTKVKEYMKSEGSQSWNFAIKGALVAVVIVGVVCGAEWYAGWRSTHQYQSPVVFRKPWHEVIPEEVYQIGEVAAKTEDEIFDQYRLAPILRSVYFLESTSGKNDACKEEGKINGFGYRQNGSEWKCYGSFEEVVEIVNVWFEDRLSTNGNNMVEAACYYNTGVANQPTCEYGQNLVSVIADRF